MRGLSILKIETHGRSPRWLDETFHSLYGSDAVVLAKMWHDVCQVNRMTKKEKSKHGLKFFLMAHFYLWNYPRNNRQFAVQFDVCDEYARGKHLWDWIARIVALKDKKIKWSGNLDAENTATFILSVDGVDFQVWEKKHPQVNKDPAQCSKKFNKAALKYELGIAIFEPRLVWINGPFRGGKHDIAIFCSEGGLKEKVKPFKKVIADRGYQSNFADEKMLSLPNVFAAKP